LAADLDSETGICTLKPGFEKSSYFETLKILYNRQSELEIEFEIMQNTEDKETLYKGG